MTSNEFPVLRQCKTLCASLVWMHKSNKNIIVSFLINEFEMSGCKNEKQFKLEKCRYLSQAFSFSATVGLDSELNRHFLAIDWLV